jgi:hypothetical protein
VFFSGDIPSLDARLRAGSGLANVHGQATSMRFAFQLAVEASHTFGFK